MSRSSQPDKFAQLRDLIQQLFEDRISAEDGERLEEWVCRDQEARRIYVQYMNLYASIHWDKTHSPVPEPPALSGEPRRSRSPVLGFLGEMVQAGTGVLFRPPVLTLLFTIGLPGILLLILVLDVARQPRPPSPVATVVRTHDCVWAAGDELPAGTSLPAKQQIRLAAGLVEVRFADGASVVLEGPARFDANANGRGFLHSGKLVAMVPEGAEGFTVDTPTATVVDMGTEFGLAVDTGGATEAHVFKGQVDLEAGTRPDGQPAVRQPLRAGKAVRVLAAHGKRGPPTIEPIQLASTGFVRNLPGTLPEPRVVFAHRGTTDPRREGWVLRPATADVTPLQMKDTKAGPVVEDGVAAWSLETVGPKGLAYYSIRARNGMTQSLAAEAKERGWVMRCRVWVGKDSERVTGPEEGAAIIKYRDDELAWNLLLQLDEQGNQRLILRGASSLGANAVVPIPGSRDQYVSYEVRHEPSADGADVYVNGRCVATNFAMPRIGDYLSIRFGMLHDASNLRFALFEWGILPRKAPSTDDEADAKRPSPKTSSTEPSRGTTASVLEPITPRKIPS